MGATGPGCVALALLVAAASLAVTAIPGTTGTSPLQGPPPHLQSMFDQLATAAPVRAGSACTNFTAMIPGVGGVLLKTYFFVPADALRTDKHGVPLLAPVPTVLERTPYGASNLAGLAPGLCSRGYATVGQDFRGRFGSTGDFDFWRSCGVDAIATMDYIANQSWSNKAVTTMGGSADGIAQYVDAASPPATLRSQFVMVGSAEMHRTVYQGGAYRESLITGWLTFIKEPGYVPTVTANEGLTPYWDPIEITNFTRVTWPALHVSGHYDIFNRHSLAAFDGYRSQGGTALARGGQYLVLLPGGHCGGGAVDWKNKSWGTQAAIAIATAIQDLTTLAAPRTTPLPPLTFPNGQTVPKITWYVLGPGGLLDRGNYWTGADEWPASTPTKYYLAPKGVLQTAPPPPKAAPTMFDYDPLNPAPTLGGNNLLLPKCGPQDQSHLEARKDMAVFTSALLEHPVAITGYVRAHLSVSCTGAPDTDFVVKLTDVGEGGESMLIQDSIQRMRWRLGPQAVAPPLDGTTVYNITVVVGHTSYIFERGHRLRLTVSSSNFPRFSANPNTGQPLATPHPAAPKPVINTVWHNPLYPSFVELPVVDLADLPPL